MDHLTSSKIKCTTQTDDDFGDRRCSGTQLEKAALLRTAMRIQESLGIQTSSSFVNI